MSFSKTISVVAALASIFGAGAAGWKLAQDDTKTPSAEQVNTKYEQHITELQQQISGLQQQLVNTNPPPAVNLPAQQQTVVKQVTPPSVPTLPSPPPPPGPPAAGNFE